MDASGPTPEARVEIDLFADCEALREFATVKKPDPRSAVMTITEGGKRRVFGIEDRIATISAYQLGDAVPEDVRIHFDTAKNLYVYAWFVYRFHMVAEHHALASLELALRLRLTEVGLVNRNEEPQPALKKLLKRALSNGLLRNDQLAARDRWALSMARGQFRNEMFQKAIADGLSEWSTEDSHVEANFDDLNFDWVARVSERLLLQRNMHAHGTSNLMQTVLQTFDEVTEFINQLFAPKLSGAGRVNSVEP